MARSDGGADQRPAAGVSSFSLKRLDGAPLDESEFASRAVLVVNVASKCGYTPQYAGLQALYDSYRDRGLTILGVPCNQFGEQEPGTPDEIAAFCSATYDVSFPLTEKIEVNGPNRHPLYDWLVQQPDSSGVGGDVEWNFEKFLVAPDGSLVGRFRPGTLPESDEIRNMIETILPSVTRRTTQ